MPAPLIGLQVGKVCVPGDIYTRHSLAGLGEKSCDLRLIALKQHDLNREMRFLVKIVPHSLPNRDDLRIVGNSAQPDCFAHNPPPRNFTKNILSTGLLEERHSQKGFPDELAQNISRRRHHSPGVRIAEESLDTQML